jgi:hypothetical protein
MSISPILSIDQPCNDALHWINQRLIEANLRSAQTFDLHEARTGSIGCTCPHHGTTECDCQMVVILVYGSSNEPVTLILHGNDGKTLVSIGDIPLLKSEAGLIRAIQQALEVNGSAPGTNT